MYGGGGGTSRYAMDNGGKHLSITAGRVYGNTHVTVSDSAWVLNNVYGASLMSGMPVSSVKTTASGALHVDSTVVEDTVAITSLSIDRTTGEVVLGVAAETSTGSVDPAVAALYNIAAGANVTVKVYRTETLAAKWELVDTIENVSLSSAGTEVRAKLSDDLDTSSGFFKVEIE